MINYQQDHSHTHCFVAQEEHKKHLACCICRKKNQINARESSPYQKLKEEMIVEFTDATGINRYLTLPERYAMRSVLSRLFDSIAHSVAEAGKVTLHSPTGNECSEDCELCDGFNAAIKQSQKQLEEYFGEKV